MRCIMIGLVLVLAAMPVRAQTLEKNIANCGNDNDDISIAACTSILKAKPPVSEEWRLAAYYARGNAYRDKGLEDLAIADFTRAIALKPADIKILANLHGAIGWSYYRKKLYAECIAYTSKMIALNPDEGGGYQLRGSAYELSDQRDKAIADYRMALKFNPGAENVKAALIRLGVTP
jgi:tetratricopeptide (TPR) repeat protein